MAKVESDFAIKTNIKLVEKRESDIDLKNMYDNWIVIKAYDLYNSEVGRNKEKGPQDIELGYGCWNQRTITREFLHALGFFDEHKRYARDEFINIKLSNIK